MATTYIWKGRTPTGEVLSGEYLAENKQELINYLRKRKIIITHIRHKPKDINVSFGLKNRITTKDLGIFTRQFATMINAGLPMVQCLDILSAQLEKPSFKKIVTEVMSDVESGATLAEALKKHECFSDLFVNMIDAGEAGGILDVILNRLAVYLEKADALKAKIKSAMTYPTIVFCVAIGATIFMLMVIIPTFAQMFTDFGGSLPLPTRIVMMLSDFLRANWYLLLAIGVGSFIFIKRFYKTDAGRLRIDKLLLRIPILGQVIRKGAVARFTRTLGTLIASGVPILNGLEITARTSGNKVIENAVVETRQSISEGNTIADPLKKCGVFPPMVVQMIGVGEQTGALDEMLEKVADFYDTEVDNAVDALTAAIEPIMIVFMGAIVGGMLIAMYLPMFKLVTVVAG
ncbi:MAG: type II secretion system F family protein [Candidatus Krumholzibacteriota bacterium]|nr:type II secretion system F family protein [Candidatus Krumholzibacteriota bacterium]